jgi:hypothetical protein
MGRYSEGLQLRFSRRQLHMLAWRGADCFCRDHKSDHGPKSALSAHTDLVFLRAVRGGFFLSSIQLVRATCASSGYAGDGFFSQTPEVLPEREHGPRPPITASACEGSDKGMMAASRGP